MQNKVQSSSDSYFSFGQYLKVKASLSSDKTAEMVDKFIRMVVVDDLEKVITQMSANMGGIVADRRNGRIGPCAETATKINEVRNTNSYNDYITAKSEQCIPTNMVPAIYAHIKEKKTYVYVVRPEDEPICEYEGVQMTHGELLVAILSQCKSISDNVKIPQLMTMDKLKSLLDNSDPVQNSLSAEVLPKETALQCDIIATCLDVGKIHCGLSPDACKRNLVNSESCLRFGNKKEVVAVSYSSEILHRGVDPNQILDNGKISSKYMKEIGLDPSFSSTQQRNAMMADLVSKKDYTYYNPSWHGSKELTDEPELALEYEKYWPIVVPGGDRIVMVRRGISISLWQRADQFAAYMNVLKKVNLFYCILRSIKHQPLKAFLSIFCKRNGIEFFVNYLYLSMRLYDQEVKIKVDIAKSHKKVGNKIKDVLSVLNFDEKKVNDMEEMKLDLAEYSDLFEEDEGDRKTVVNRTRITYDVDTPKNVIVKKGVDKKKDTSGDVRREKESGYGIEEKETGEEKEWYDDVVKRRESRRGRAKEEKVVKKKKSVDYADMQGFDEPDDVSEKTVKSDGTLSSDSENDDVRKKRKDKKRRVGVRDDSLEDFSETRGVFDLNAKRVYAGRKDVVGQDDGEFSFEYGENTRESGVADW